MSNIAKRDHWNEKLDINNYFPPFISIMITHRNRPGYAIKCVDSILENTDIPAEIVLHDDGSSREVQAMLFESLNNKVSGMILNFGRNTCLATPVNRCAEMTHSKYMFLLHEHVYMRSGFLGRIKEALDLPYVGLVSISQSPLGDGPNVMTLPSGTKIKIGNVNIVGDYFGFRRSVYEEVGGWDENVQFANADIGFTGNVFGRGYFSVVVEGDLFDERLSPKGPNDNIYVGSQMDGCNNAPPIFGMNPSLHQNGCARRDQEIWGSLNHDWANDKFFPTWYNHHFLGREIDSLFPGFGKIDWEFAETYGHIKWKEQIERDFPGLINEKHR